MTQKEAYEYLADAVNDYVLNGESLVALCGMEPGGKPDSYHVEKLRTALTVLGLDGAKLLHTE